LKKLLEKYVSESLSTVLANVLLFLKGSQIASEALQTYFEYDWSSFGENYEDALYYLTQKEGKERKHYIKRYYQNCWNALAKSLARINKRKFNRRNAKSFYNLL
jgi:hypothetical protein